MLFFRFGYPNENCLYFCLKVFLTKIAVKNQMERDLFVIFFEILQRIIFAFRFTHFRLRLSKVLELFANLRLNKII